MITYKEKNDHKSNVILSGLGTLVFLAAIGMVGLGSCTAAEIDRSVLPIRHPDSPPITEMDARNATKPESFTVEAPEDAPNVVIVLIDDIWSGATAAFSGAINTPTFSRLTKNGLRFNHFHTTALCSPTRALLLSRRNHHNLNVRSVMEVATGFPGNLGMWPDDAKYFAETLRHKGYSTAVFGKWRETPT